MSVPQTTPQSSSEPGTASSVESTTKTINSNSNSVPVSAPAKRKFQDENNSSARGPDGEVHAVIVPPRSEPPELTYQGKTGIAYDTRMRYHSRVNATPDSYLNPHPEEPRRTFRIYKSIAEAGLIEDPTLQGTSELGGLMEKLVTRAASDEELRLVHSQAHLDFIASTENMSKEELCRETDEGDSIYLNNDSHLAARLSCGSAIEACRAVLDRRVKNALAVIRPPGHHAEPDKPSGFCLFSNVAVAAKVILRDYPETVKKILIYDWDVHHGNGTMRAFVDDPRVLYVSTHRHDNGVFYPATSFGNATTVGEGAGAGFSINIPFNQAGMGDGDYMAAFHRIVLPVASEFDPDLVIISAGFDAAEGDPIGCFHLSPAAYGQMTHMLKSFANGKLVVCLEGGYNLDSISRSALAVAKVLLGDPPGRIDPEHRLPSASALETIAEVIAVQSKYWRSLGPRIPVLDYDEADELDVEDLASVLRSFEARKLARMFGLAPLRLLRPHPNFDVAEDQVISTPGIFEAEKVMVILHDPSEVWAFRDDITGEILPQDSKIANVSLPYVRWAKEHGYGVVDMATWGISRGPPYGSGLKITTSTAQELSKDLMDHFWESSATYFGAKKIVLVGIGVAYAAIAALAGQRDLRGLCSAIIGVLGANDPLVAIKTPIDERANWFYEQSLIVASEHNSFWKKAVKRRKFGRVIPSKSDDVYSVMRGSFEACTNHILMDD